MKLFTVILMFLMAWGCTTLKPVELAPEQLHERIVSGAVIHAGDSVHIVTSDGIHHKFTVTGITENSIAGRDVDIPIKHVVALETREFSGGKSSLLVGGTLLWMYFILLSIPAVFIL
jgi:hypothetical protein